MTGAPVTAQPIMRQPPFPPQGRTTLPVGQTPEGGFGANGPQQGIVGQTPMPGQGVPGQQPAAPGGELSNILAGLGISNVSPLQPTYAPNPPTINPATLGTGLTSQLSPQSSIAQILNYAKPLFANSQRSLNDQLAAMGMFGGPALNATSALNSNLMSSIGPMLAQAIQGSQNNILRAGEFNADALNQGNFANLQNLINNQMFNTQTANAAGTNLWDAIMQGWQIPFGAYQNINQAGLSGAQGLAGYGVGNAGSLAGMIANNFPVSQPPDTSGLGSALGALFAPKQPPPYQNPMAGLGDYTYVP